MELKDFKKGRNYKVIANRSGHGYSIGSIVKCTSVNNTYVVVNSIFFYSDDLGLAIETREDLQESLTNILKQKSEIEDKLTYINEVGNETFDENEYKTYKTLTLLDNKKLSKIEKARIIAGMINQ